MTGIMAQVIADADQANFDSVRASLLHARISLDVSQTMEKLDVYWEIENLYIALFQIVPSVERYA